MIQFISMAEWPMENRTLAEELRRLTNLTSSERVYNR